MGNILDIIISSGIVAGWSALLYFSYTHFKHPTRLLLQSIFIIPFTILTSIICVFCGMLIKYLTFNLITNAQRIYILSAIITYAFWQIAFFLLEFWTNVRMVVSDENVNDDIFHLNSMIISNHSASPFDWVSVASMCDYLMRFDKSFVFMKKAFMYVPAIGWVGTLCNSITLDRNWNKDKLRIANLCKQFTDKDGDYKSVTPWMWVLYPEGTRFSKKKLKDAQIFAKKRGFTVYDNILQPRVKGFSYLIHHLYDNLGVVIDSTVIYKSKPPDAYGFFINTRFCKYIHFHLKCYRKDKISNDIELLNKWLRDRWTEKDKIIAKMKENKLKFVPLKRSPNIAICYYIFWSFLINFIIINLIFEYEYLSIISLLILITSLFPVIIVLIEHSENIDLNIDDKKKQ